jgi:hypothetical protein
VILGLSQKVMSNYTNHVARTPVSGPAGGASCGQAPLRTPAFIAPAGTGEHGDRHRAARHGDRSLVQSVSKLKLDVTVPLQRLVTR